MGFDSASFPKLSFYETLSECLRTHGNPATTAFVTQVGPVDRMWAPEHSHCVTKRRCQGWCRKEVLPPCWAQWPSGLPLHMGLLRCQISVVGFR